jgi:hypothetical protein
VSEVTKKTHSKEEASGGHCSHSWRQDSLRACIKIQGPPGSGKSVEEAVIGIGCQRSFKGSKKAQSGPSEALVSQLYEEIGKLKFELDWLKKKASRFGGV